MTDAWTRFEQTNLELQPNAPSAMGMVAEDPVRLVDGRKASCDGGELPPPGFNQKIGGADWQRRWTAGTPEDLHQLGQARTQGLRVLASHDRVSSSQRG